MPMRRVIHRPGVDLIHKAPWAMSCSKMKIRTMMSPRTMLPSRRSGQIGASTATDSAAAQASIVMAKSPQVVAGSSFAKGNVARTNAEPSRGAFSVVVRSVESDIVEIQGLFSDTLAGWCDPVGHYLRLGNLP